MFTIESIAKICKAKKINVFIYSEAMNLHFFVNSEKDKEKLEVFDDTRSCNVAPHDIQINKNIVIEGVVILQTSQVPFFENLEILKEKQIMAEIVEYNSIKNKLKRFLGINKIEPEKEITKYKKGKQCK